VSDFIEINCTVEYKGSWTPNVSCVPEAPARRFDEETSAFHRLSYIRVMAAAELGDRAVITCKTTFFRSETALFFVTADNRQIRILTDTPRYQSTWHSLPIRVFNTTGS